MVRSRSAEGRASLEWVCAIVGGDEGVLTATSVAEEEEDDEEGG